MTSSAVVRHGRSRPWTGSRHRPTMAAAYAAVVPVLEIPSGILADRWSRRGVLMRASGCALLSVLVGALSTGVASYIVSAMILGVFFALSSGTVDSNVYDTLTEETRSA